MGMIHGGNSASYWLGSCLHLGRMWPHNTPLSGPSLSDFDQPLLEALFCYRPENEDKGMQQKSKDERLSLQGKKFKFWWTYFLVVSVSTPLALCFSFPPLPPSVITKWCAVGEEFKTMNLEVNHRDDRREKPWLRGGSCRCDAWIMFPYIRWRDSHKSSLRDDLNSN